MTNVSCFIEDKSLPPICTCLQRCNLSSQIPIRRENLVSVIPPAAASIAGVAADLVHN